jgi:hypothetical protein
VPSINRRYRKRVIERDLRTYSKNRLKSLEEFSHCRSRFGSSITEQLAEADVINLHWTVGLPNYTGLFGTLAKEKPVVWTLHDTNRFTAGCRYNAGCELFTQQCAACPQLGSSKTLDISFRIFKEKGRALKVFENLSIVTPSQWLAVPVRPHPA